MNFTIEDSPNLEGTSKAIVYIQDMAFLPFDYDGSDDTIMLRIQYASRACGAILDEVRDGPEPLILVDKYLRLYLHASTRGTVDLESFQPPEAKNLRIELPEAWKGSKDERDIQSILRGKPVTAGQQFPLVTLAGGVKEAQLLDTQPEGIVVVMSDTSISLESEKEKPKKAGVTYINIGGLKRELERIRELIELPLRLPEQFERMGIDNPRGVILYGPPGTGKTLMAEALCNEIGANFFPIQGPEIMSSYFAGSEKALRDKFEEARNNTPAVILIDELDSIVPSREKTTGETEHRMVTTLISELDKLSKVTGVAVIGTTNRLNAIDIALRRAGRFETIHVGPPDRNGRVEIINIHLERMKQAGSLAEDIDTEDLAERTPGYVGADIALLAREAAYCALRRSVPIQTIEQKGIDPEMMTGIKVFQEDFISALGLIRPSAMREVMAQMPLEVTWEQIGGLEEVKRTLIESVVYGIKKPETFKELGIKPPKGLLLYGPPGTGKTMLAKAVSHACGGHFIPVRGPEIRSKWFGESEENVRFIFAKAREVAPCVIFFDEIDSLTPTRGRDASGIADSIVNQILTEFDNLQASESVFVLGATNSPDLIDPAMLRPGRFDRQIYVPLPDVREREDIFSIYLRQNTRCSPDVSANKLAEITEGMSGADISEICYLAGRYALRAVDFEAGKATVTMEYYQQAVADVKQTQKHLKPRIGFRTSHEE